MPSVTAVALDSLLDRGASGGGGGGRGSSHHQNHPHRSNDGKTGRDRQGSGSGAAANGSLGVDVRRTSSLPYYFSPSLYTTPEPARISGSSPTSVSPSPYVVNIKRRGFRPPPPQVSGSDGVKEEEEVGGKGDGEADKEEERFEEGKENTLPVDQDLRETCLSERFGFDKEEARDDEIDEFFKPRDSMSVTSNSDAEDGGGAHRQVPCKGISASTNSEFYDATEDFFSDNSASLASPLRTNIEADLHSLRLNLFEEIEKRKKAEGFLAHMQKQWKKMDLHFTHLGLPFPAMPNGSDIKHETDEIAQVCQEIVVVRFVSEALERGLAEAEIEESAEMIIKSKNHEISRLHDRLRYYEAMNHEMSQRNQENIELARKKRQQRRRRQKCLWFCIGLSLTVGASLLAYSFTPEASKDQSASKGVLNHHQHNDT